MYSSHGIWYSTVRTVCWSGAWITSAGTYCGVMKHVGKAVRDYGVARNSTPIVCLGIAPWGQVQNREALINQKVPLN